jgi:isoleucyl-tRNA synthetase
LLRGTADIIAEELNVKNVDINADDSELVSLSVKANFKALGPKLGKNMKQAAETIAAFSSKQAASLLNGGKVSIDLPDYGKLDVAIDDVVLQREERPGLCVATEKEITVALDTVLTDELRKEGFAREFVSRVQNLRKEMGFEVSDRIDIFYDVLEGEWSDAVAEFADYIRNETLAVELKSESEMDERSDGVRKVEINGTDVLVLVKKRN